jgi:hypothetical protein
LQQWIRIWTWPKQVPSASTTQNGILHRCTQRSYVKSTCVKNSELATQILSNGGVWGKSMEADVASKTVVCGSGKFQFQQR